MIPLARWDLSLGSGGLVVLTGSLLIGRNNVILTQPVVSVDRESIH